MNRRKLSSHYTDGFETCDPCGADIVDGMRVNDHTPLGVVCATCCSVLKVIKPSAIAIGPEAAERKMK